MQNFRVLGLHPQTPVPPAAGGSALRPPHCKFLATRLVVSVCISVVTRSKDKDSSIKDSASLLTLVVVPACTSASTRPKNEDSSSEKSSTRLSWAGRSAQGRTLVKLGLIKVSSENVDPTIFSTEVVGTTQSASQPVPSLRGGQGDPAPLTTACAPHFGLVRIFFEASRNDKTTGNNGKRNNNVQDNSCLKFSLFFAKLLDTNCCT